LSLCTGCAMKRSSVEKERRRTVEVEAERVTAKVKMIKGHPSSSLSEFLTWAAVADIPHHSRALANASASLVRESVRRCTFHSSQCSFPEFPGCFYRRNFTHVHVRPSSRNFFLRRNGDEFTTTQASRCYHGMHLCCRWTLAWDEFVIGAASVMQHLVHFASSRLSVCLVPNMSLWAQLGVALYPMCDHCL
jgi:hypothetical protein